MTTDSTSMHRVFLAELRERLKAREAELAELRAVEKYHAAIIAGSCSQLSTTAEIKANDQQQVGQNSAATTANLKGKKKHEAAEIALAALGGPAKTPAIVAWLRDHGYTPEQDLHVMHSAIFTAMARHSERFQRVEGERGTWRLIRSKGKIEENSS